MAEFARNEKWILRHAKLSDYKEITSFHSQGTFEGLDYMPVTYHRLLQDKNSNAFVATTHDGKVVSSMYLRSDAFVTITKFVTSKLQ